MLTKLGRAPPKVVAAPLPPPKPADTVPSKRRPLDQVLLSTYVPSYERSHPPTGMVAPGL